MYYDLHIHSTLSACADDDMTPNNIINMAVLKGLDLIAVCDHNTTKQQAGLAKAASGKNISLIYGIEVQTKEEIHVLAYFKELCDCKAFGKLIDEKIPAIKNNPQYFGHQYVVDIYDKVVYQEECLLLNSVNMTIEEVEIAVHKYHGSFVLAHALDRQNSIITQLGFIPLHLKIDAVEIKNIQQKEILLANHKWLKDTIWLINSDAHQLKDINERVNKITDQELKRLLRNES
ncbi:MAG: PHP domain-containing protein [Erysipelotrichaceae bacterium]|nr:PHP domain-containing protein [Erysipelotrichaceae bacterium]